MGAGRGGGRGRNCIVNLHVRPPVVSSHLSKTSTIFIRSPVVGTSCKRPPLVSDQDRLYGVTFLGFSFVLDILYVTAFLGVISLFTVFVLCHSEPRRTFILKTNYLYLDIPDDKLSLFQKGDAGQSLRGAHFPWLLWARPLVTLRGNKSENWLKELHESEHDLSEDVLCRGMNKLSAV